MALLLLDDVRPRRLLDDIFDVDLTPSDFLSEILSRRRSRPWRNLALAARDVGSTIKTDKTKFQVNMDVQHFAPEEITVKTADRCIIIEGKHEEKKDEHGYVSREFKRRYFLPEDCNPDTVESRLSSDGVLTVVAARATEKGERIVPITQTGPIRRKREDEEEIKQIENGDEKEKEDLKSPQKKRRR